MNCPSCNTPLRPGASFCPGCGNPVRREYRCPECNAPLVPGDAFCSNCGAAILSNSEPSFSPSQYKEPSQQNLKSVPPSYDEQARPPHQLQQKSRWVYVFLALLTPFGIHDFYAERFKSAFALLCIDILSVVFWFSSQSAAAKGNDRFFGPNSNDIYQRDTFMGWMILCVLISGLWCLIECFAVKHDGKGVKMK